MLELLNGINEAKKHLRPRTNFQILSFGRSTEDQSILEINIRYPSGKEAAVQINHWQWAKTDQDWARVGAMVLIDIVLESGIPYIDTAEAVKILGSGKTDRRIR